MGHLTMSEINALVDALESGFPPLYKAVQPPDRQGAFVADANSIVDVAASEGHMRAFARLESIEPLTDWFKLPPGERVTASGHDRIPIRFQPKES